MKDGEDRTCEEQAVKRRTLKSRPAAADPLRRPPRVLGFDTEFKRRILPFRRSLRDENRTPPPFGRYLGLEGSPGGGIPQGGRRGGEGREGSVLREGCDARLPGERSEGRSPLPKADHREGAD